MRPVVLALFAAAASLAVAAPAAATLQPQGEPTVLDAAFDCGNADPVVAPLAGGGFVVAWSDGVTLSTRRLDAAGQPAAPEVALAVGHPLEPEVVGLANGGYALAWFDRTRGRILARFVDAAGVAGEELEVGAAGPDPGSGFGGLDATASDAGGTLAVVWTHSEIVYLRELRPDGSALSAPYAVEAYWQAFQIHAAFVSPVVLAAADGSLRVFWVVGNDYAALIRDGEILGRRLVRDAALDYGVTGSITTDAFGHDPEAAMAADGSYLLAWVGMETFYLDPPPPISEFPAVLARAFDSADQPRNEPQVIDGTALAPAAAVAVAAAPTGGFAVAWESDLEGGVEGVTTALARGVDVAGFPQGPSRLAPASSVGQARPDLAFGAGGLLLATWQELDDPDVVHIVCPGAHVRARPFRIGCSESGLCLGGGRFELTLTYADPRRGLAGSGHPVALTADTAYFWFFAPDQVEVVAKVIDGRAVNGHFWVFWGGLTDLGLRLTVRDMVNGQTRTYETAPGTMVSAADTSALRADGAFAVQQLRSFALDREAFAVGADATAGVKSDVRALAAAAATDAATARAATRQPASLAGSAAGPCSPPELPVVPRPGLCLTGERFEVEASWRDFAGRTGAAEGVEIGDDSGYFWFFAPDNLELMVKVLDGRAANGRFWVFYGALTNVEYDLVVRHAGDGTTWRHHNPSGAFGSAADVDALEPPGGCACPGVYDPVCGRDGNTYSNACAAECFGWTTVASNGPCPGG